MYHIAKRRNGNVLVSPTEYLLKLIINKPTYANTDKEIMAICMSSTFNARKEARRFLNEAVSVDFVQKSPEIIIHLQEILKNRYVYGK